ncbi:DUF4173 domain-containing protein [Mesorhizobium sp. ES1-1]|uniref:DUF4153 domain-containing protein n=1 Tax=Mesorhizobium sp. ES1-1 TaxID=2876629 RepID=UPI001CCD6D74|nr:DUF4173 domain-containing protein [Mesorhizobium sp. ES1-1]MBZ9675269.1 DUF4173 domain-containing protein [Mesorhizobium sp. ES1-1]
MTGLFSAAPSFGARFGVAALVVVLADFLFYGQPFGITVLLFAILLGAAVIALHPTAFDARVWAKPVALLAALLPLAENVSALSVSIALAALVAFSLSLSGRLTQGLVRIVAQIGQFWLAAPFRFIRDFIRWRRTVRRFGRRRLRPAAIAVWVMPLTLGAVFLALFGAANPVIDYWLSQINLMKLLNLIELARIAFWLFMLAGVWAFLRPRLPRFPQRLAGVKDDLAKALPAPDAERQVVEGIVFGRPAILRALVVFNVLFAMQTGLDAAYLWGGVALPDGLSYAAYAHRGAYPLIVTALLAAGFVLAALRPGSATSADPTIRRLVYAWVAQNIMLVISSILRLDLYIGVYALTYWRIAAFVWMGLVAAGLALIIARIALGKSNAWLSSANLVTLSLTLYACCFVNFAAMIANYNVDHSLEMTGQGIPLDAWYVRSLGPGAFPALDRFFDHKEKTPDAGAVRELQSLRTSDEGRYRTLHRNWRAWSFRDWRLARYLDSKASLVLPQPSLPNLPGR